MAVELLFKVGIIPLQELNFILVLASTEAREGLVRTVPLLEKVCS
jgi:hypothetical protein